MSPEFISILEDFGDRFVIGTDYGGGRAPLAEHLTVRYELTYLIIRDLSDETRHNIAYRNAWRLLTGSSW